MFNLEPVLTEIFEKEEQHPKDGWWVTDLSKCLRGVYYQRLGYEPDTPVSPRVKRIFKVGNIFEEWITNALKQREDLEITAQEPLTLPEKHLTGRLDFTFVNPQNKKVEIVELKTMHSNGFWYRKKQGFTALPQHIEQVTLYQYLWGLKHKVDPNTIAGRVLYISKDDLTIMECGVPFNQKVLDEAMRKLDILEKAWKEKKPPEPAPNIIYDETKRKWVVNWVAKYCPYHKRCTNDVNWLEKAQQEVRNKNNERTRT